MTRIDVGHVDVGMDEVGEPNDAVEEVTQTQMEEQGDRVQLEH